MNVNELDDSVTTKGARSTSFYNMGNRVKGKYCKTLESYPFLPLVEILTFDQVLRLGAFYRRQSKSPDQLAAYMTESDRGKYVFTMDAEGNVTGRRAFWDEGGSC